MALPLYNGAAVGPNTRYYREHSGGVAVGPATRAYRQGARPAAWAPPASAPAGPGGGAPATPAAGPGGGAPAWTPPPTGLYDPSRDTAVRQGELGLGQFEEGAATKRTRGIADYATEKQGIEREQTQEGENFNTARANLVRAFQQLAGKQTQQANQYGVLGGGAQLASAAARSTNQGREEGVQNLAHSRAGEAFALKFAKLAQELAPPDATNPEGGRYFQDIGSGVRNAQANQTFFANAEHGAAGQEAAERGYEAPPWLTLGGQPSGVVSKAVKTPGGSVAIGTATRAYREAHRRR